MRYLGIMFDLMINKNYDLYEINAKIIKDRLDKTYKMSKVRLQMFNNSNKLSSAMTTISGIMSGKRCNHDFSDNSSYSRKTVREEIDKIKNNLYVGELNKISGAMGYELMPIAVVVKDKAIQNTEAEVELMDGFRRMFFVKEVPDRNILVKVYDSMSDSEWINAMIVFNSWKFAQPQIEGHYWDRNEGSPILSQVLIDRGFRLGLYHRYNIDFDNLVSYTHHLNIWKLINLYFNNNPYMTLWNNDQFYNDILTLIQIENYQPVFSYSYGKKTIKTETFNCDINRIRRGEQSHFLQKIFCMYIKMLGDVRRIEYKKEETGELVARKPFVMECYKEFLSCKELQPDFIKLSQMSVPGFIDNYLDKNIKIPMEKHIGNWYFGEDIFLATRKREEPLPITKPIDISEIKL